MTFEDRRRRDTRARLLTFAIGSIWSAEEDDASVCDSARAMASASPPSAASARAEGSRRGGR